MSNWNPADHPRDARGRFGHSTPALGDLAGLRVGDQFQRGNQWYTVGEKTGGQSVRVKESGKIFTALPGEQFSIRSGDGPPTADPFVSRIDNQVARATQPSDPIRDYAWGQGSSGLLFAEMNAALRGKTGMSPQARALQRGLSDVFNRTPRTTQPMTVHRVVAGDQKLARKLVSTARRGGVWSDPAPMSTTRSADVAEDFAVGDHVVELVITVPRGGRVVDVDAALGDDLEYPQEEILLPGNSQLQLGRTYERDGRTIVEATVIV